jgi:hypothetical protein
MKPNKQKQTLHRINPAKLTLEKLCNDTSFKRRVNELRHDWKITKLAKSFEEANGFWENLCEVDRSDPDYYDKYDRGETQHQRFQYALEVLGGDPAFGLPPDPEMWLVMFHVVSRFDLDNVTEEDILTLPLPPSLSRINVIPMNNRLYLDVTFATRKDIAEVWSVVKFWQKRARPYFVRGVSIVPNELRPRQPLPNLLKDVVPGRPRISDAICLEAAKLKDEEGKTYLAIAKLLDLPKQRDAYDNLTRSRTAQEAVKRGRVLRNLRT